METEASKGAVINCMLCCRERASRSGRTLGPVQVYDASRLPKTSNGTIAFDWGKAPAYVSMGSN